MSACVVVDAVAGEGSTEDASPPGKPTIVYIAGSGRSGSTLLERALGAVPGYANVGELLDLPRRVAPHNELCGCGEPFDRCAFWTAVGASQPQAWDPDWLAEVHRLQARVARQRHLPRLLAGATGGEFGRDLTAYTEALTGIYRAVAAQSGSDVVVDASKWPSLALALHEGGLDVRVVHLVRDAHGVAHSLSKPEVARPHTTGDDTDTMYHNSTASAAARWVATQTETDLLATRGVPVARLAYEEFVRTPGPAIRRVLAALDLPLPPDGLAHIDGQAVTLGPSHGLSGNPSRFRHGTIRLRSDEGWRTAMPARDRRLVSVIAAPQLALTRRDALRRSAADAGPVDAADLVAADPVAPADREPTGWPLVSVVVPTHGRPELVREAVASVVAQDYAGDIEVVVVHDQEDEDPTLELLSRDRSPADPADPAAPARTVRTVSNTRTPGLVGSRNTGLERTTGDLVASLDDDDSWHPEKVRRQVERFLAEPDLLALGTGLRIVLPDGSSADWPGRADHVTRTMLLRNRVKELHSSTLMMRRDAFAKAGLYDETLPRGYGEDWDIVLRISRVGRIGVVREPLADIRRDGQSYYQRRAEHTATALAHFLAVHPEIAEDRRGHARLLGQMGFARSSLGQRKEAAGLAARGVARWPLSPHPSVALAHVATGADPASFARVARRLGRGMA